MASSRILMLLSEKIAGRVLILMGFFKFRKKVETSFILGTWMFLGSVN